MEVTGSSRKVYMWTCPKCNKMFILVEDYEDHKSLCSERKIRQIRQLIGWLEKREKLAEKRAKDKQGIRQSFQEGMWQAYREMSAELNSMLDHDGEDDEIALIRKISREVFHEEENKLRP